MNLMETACIGYNSMHQNGLFQHQDNQGMDPIIFSRGKSWDAATISVR